MKLKRFWQFLAVAATVMAFTYSANAEPMDGDSKSDKDGPKGVEGNSDNNTSKSPSIIGYSDSDNKKNYQPKSDSEGSTWTFDPQKVELNSGTSDSGTNFMGARILKGEDDVVVQGELLPGKYDDKENNRYSYWQGSTLFFGVENADTGNSVDTIVEFFWFESSIPRGSDFYVAQIKVKSSPNPWDNWVLPKEPGFIDEYIFFWNDIQPAQHLDVYMESGGEHGALRWDFSVPFETYKWEPVKTMQVSESYGAGYSLQGTANGKGQYKKQFKEGSEVLDLTADASIQAKGYVNSDFKVQSQYTITLYKWQMLVQSGGEDIHWKLVLLPHDKEKDNQSDSGYYEYFVVFQATRGTPVHVEEIEVGGMFRHNIPLWFDTYDALSVSVGDIWITPPTGVCLPGDIAPPDTCNTQGVCGMAVPECVENQWRCPVMNVFEEIETSCDGLDNDCDGVIDEDVIRECSTSCGTGYEVCIDGKFKGCDAPQPIQELCGDKIDNDCDGMVDNGCEEDTPLVTPPLSNNGNGGTPGDNGTGTNGNGSNSNQPYNGNNNFNPSPSSSNGSQYPSTNSGGKAKTPVPLPNTGCTTGTGPQAPTGVMLIVFGFLALAIRLRRKVAPQS
jgi:hypothetical protein